MKTLAVLLYGLAMAPALAGEPCRITDTQWGQIQDLETWAPMADHVCRGETSYVSRGGQDWAVMRWVVERPEGVAIASIAFDLDGLVTETYWDPRPKTHDDGSIHGLFFGAIEAQDDSEMEVTQ